MKRYSALFLLILLSFFVPKEVYAQCITSFTVTAITDISCRDGNDGEITVELVGGQGPFRYILDIQTPNGDIDIGDVSNTYDRTVTFSLANNNAGDFGIMAKDPNNGSIYSYRVRVISTGPNNSPGCTSRSLSGITFSEPAAHLAVSIDAEDASCNGGNDGEATANPAGGTAPYTYEWTTTPVQTTQTATGLSVGTYTVTITDANGCITDNSVTIEQPTSLTLTTSQTGITCNGADDGEATVNVTGGTGPYIYSWNTTPVRTTQTATGLAPGTYTVTVTDDKGCSGTSDVIIVEPDLLVASIGSHADASCNGAADGEATVSVAGGTAPYTYSWNTSPVQTSATATGLIAGNYVVTITDDNGCTTTESVVIDEPAPVIASIDNSTDASCNGGNDGTATASASGGTAPYTYSWNTSPTQNSATATGLAAGVYIVTITDANGCFETASVTIDEPTPIVINISAVQDATCNGEGNGEATATASGGTAPYIYSWNTMPAQNAATAIGLAAGTYTVTVEDANGCIETASVTISEPDELVATVVSTDITCHGSDDGQVEVTVTGGTAGYAYSLDGTTFQSNNIFDNLVAGTYTITVRDANGCTVTTTATIDEPLALTATVSSTDATCNGAADGTIMVTALDGTAGYEYALDGTTFQSNNIFENLVAGSYTITVRDANGCTVSATATIDEPLVLTASALASDANCNGGSDGTITVTAGGGTPSYEYSLNGTTFQASNLFENLIVGNYTITVRDDNGCTVTATATVDAPDALVVSATAVDATCNGTADGTITVTAQDGTPGYEYSLDGTTFQASNTFIGLVAGNYTITVRDTNGCTETASVTISAPDELLAMAVSTDITCHGSGDGQVEVAVTGGTAGYAYSLDGTTFQSNNIFDNLVAGTYTITVRDANGCTTTATTTINEPLALTATVSSADATCNGAADGTITVTALDGTAGYEYALDGTTFQASNIFENLVAGSYTITVRDANGCSVTATTTIAEPAELTAIVSTTDASCDGGSDGTITVVAGGGSADYEYSLDGTTFQASNLFENLIAGNYTITVRDDNGCTVTATATVDAPDALVVSATAVDATCNGTADGTITVTAQDGTPGYEYSLDGTAFQAGNTFTGLAAGNYTVTVKDAGGCVVTVPVTVNEPDELMATVVSTDITCHGSDDGQVEMTVTGGTAGYEFSLDGLTFQANNIFDNLVAGTYTITVRDANGCTTTATTTIDEPAALTATVSSTDATCNGGADGTATVSITGGTAPYSFNWNTTPAQTSETATGLSAGTYSVTITDANGCSITENITIAEPTPLVVTIDNQVDVSCNGGNDGEATVTTSGGTGPYSYSWSTTPVQTTALATGLAAGTYSVIVTDNNGCSEILNVTIGEPASLTATAVTLPDCDGGGTGSIDLTVNGGTAPYIYTWSGGLPGQEDHNGTVAAAIYSVTIEDANGCAITLNDIEVAPQIIADAGSDQTICTDETALSANPVAADQTGEWIILSGHGDFGNINDPNTTVSNLNIGTNEFIWSVTDISGDCTPSTDIVTILRNSISEADAGEDEIVCSDITKLDAGAVAAGETGTWIRISGNGILSDIHDPKSEVINLSEGDNLFKWVITDDAGICAESSDIVNIHYTVLSIADAGDDQTICVDQTELSAQPLKAGEIGEWSSFGNTATITDKNNPTTTVTGLSVGTHIFIWSISDAAGACGFRTDDVKVHVIGDLTEADAGADQNVCIDEVTLAANAVGAGETGKWTVLNGSGNFVDDTDPTTEVSGLAIGLNQFVWTITDNSGTCPASEDIVDVYYIVVTEALAGPDQSVCTDVVTLAANAAQTGEVGTWTVLSGTGDFQNENDPETLVENLSVGINEFVWTIADAANACAESSDIVRIEVIGDLTVADAGADQDVCIDEVTLAANAVGAGETGKWTVLNGSGNFVDDTDPTTEVSGLAIGLNQFVWTITDNSGTCPASEDIVDVYYIVVTEALAGPDQSVCTDVVTLAANAAQAGEVGTWTVLSGTGDFQGENDPETLVENLSVGINEFVWTIADAANACAESSDIVRIEVIGNLTVADAGTDQDVCIDEVTLAANAVGVGETGAWVLISGTGQIDNTNNATTLVTGLSLGDNEFEWRITDDNGICPDSYDRVIITFSPQVTPPAVAITNFDYCIGEAMDAFEATGTGIKWYDDEALTNEVGAGSSFTPSIDNTVAGTHTFYVTQTAVGCGESEAVEVIVNIDDSSPAPVVDIPLVEVCQNGVIPTLEATGSNLTWYADAALTEVVGAGSTYTPSITALDMTTVGTTEFYVTQNIGCGESPAVPVLVEVTNISNVPVVVTPGAFCQNSPQPTLVATGTNLAWYADAALTVQVGTGPTYTPDATVLDMSVAGTTIFYVTQDQGCGESAAVSVAVNVLDANDPACIGGGTGCGVFTQVFIDNVVNPSCNSSGIISQDGEFLFNVLGGNAPYTYRIESAEGIEEQFNNPYFDGLKAGTYLATVKDVLGNECSITYTLLVESNLVGVASNMVDAVCYGSNTGQATITITEGGNTGFYSFNDGDTWFPFTSGNTVNNLPPKGTYNLLIGNQANDPCPGLVEVTINNQNEEIKVAGFNTVTPASCDNNDGEVQIAAITGGSGNYTFELDGKPYSMPDDFIIRGLGRDEHTIKVTDDMGCSITSEFYVDSPGLVKFVTNESPANCGEADGVIEVIITEGLPPYYYSVNGGVFEAVVSNPFKVKDLPQGNYEIIIKSGNPEEACPNIRDVQIFGHSVVNYEVDVTHIACYGDESGVVSFTNISGGEINMQVTGPNGYSRSVTNVGYNREFRNLEPGTYTFEFVQLGECNSTKTEIVTIRQPRKLYAEIKDATISLPDIPTGSITVRVDQMSGTGPYVATVQRTYPTGDAFFYLQEDTVRMNSMNLQYELTFHDAPAGDYTVHVRDANGCDTTMTVLVDYDRRIFIPNVFTPNGDDANETFFVRNLPEEGAQMIITNRWGKVVYSNDNYDNMWDGGDLPDGIYYYKLILEEENFSGWVEIWRGSFR